MYTTTEAPAGPVLFTATAHGVRTEIRDLEAFQAANGSAESVLEALLMHGEAVVGEVNYQLEDAQRLIQALG